MIAGEFAIGELYEIANHAGKEPSEQKLWVEKKANYKIMEGLETARNGIRMKQKGRNTSGGYTSFLSQSR